MMRCFGPRSPVISYAQYVAWFESGHRSNNTMCPASPPVPGPQWPTMSPRPQLVPGDLVDVSQRDKRFSVRPTPSDTGQVEAHRYVAGAVRSPAIAQQALRVLNAIKRPDRRRAMHDLTTLDRHCPSRWPNLLAACRRTRTAGAASSGGPTRMNWLFRRNG